MIVKIMEFQNLVFSLLDNYFKMRNLLTIILIFLNCFLYSQDGFKVVYEKKINPNLDHNSLNKKQLGYLKYLSKNISKFHYSLEIDLKNQNSKFSSNYEMSTDGQARIDRQVLNILNSRYPIYTNMRKDSIYEFSNHPVLGSEILTRFYINSYNWILTDSTRTFNGYKCKLAKGFFSQKNPLTDAANKVEFFAWYSSDLPSQFGPAFFTGLPGLVLVAGYDMFIFEMKEIKYQDVEFEFPKNKSITEEELILKMKSFMNNN